MTFDYDAYERAMEAQGAGTTEPPTKGEQIKAAVWHAKRLISSDLLVETLKSLDGFGHSLNDQRGDTLQDIRDGNQYVIDAMELTGLFYEGSSLPLDIKVAEQIMEALDEWLVGDTEPVAYS